MAVNPDLVDQITASIADLYRQVETALITTVAQRLRQDPPLPSPFQEAKLDAVAKLRRSAATILASLQAARSKVIRQAVAQAYGHGYGTALADLPEGWFPKSGIGQQARQAIAGQLPNTAVIERLAQALHADVGRVDANILRAPIDAFRAVQAGTAARIATGAYTRREAAQAAWQRLVDKGIVTFTDRAGRVWRLSSYVEMIGRTNIARAAIQGQTDRLTSVGLALVIVSDHGQECSKCRPFEGKVLALSGPTGRIEVEHATKDGVMVTVDVVATLDQARADGFQHPNAILGDQGCRVLGQIENAARAWYDGPSVHLTTARGHRLTVSPNHPVLTSLGWLAADRIREGMHVFSATDREGVDAASGSVEDLDNVPASFEQVFDALAAHGLRTRVAVAADDFHGDGRHYEGEVDVVWTERALLDVLQPYSVEQLGEGCLVRPGVELQALAGGCSALAPVHGVASPVARSLSDFDAVRLEASSQRRLADAEDPSEVLAGLSCEVALDEVVNVDRDWYRGHAYDLQTSTGAYLTADIVVHNCRHSVSAYQAGITKQPKHTADPQGDKARQKQRALERKIRAAKEQAAGALTPEAKKEAGANVRAAQAQLRAHLKAHPKLKRLPYREQIGAGNIPKKGGPSGGPVDDLQPPVQPTLDGGPGAQAPVPREPEVPAHTPKVPGQLSLDDAPKVTLKPKTAPEPAPKPKPTGVETGDFSSLWQVGRQSGSNPGGLFEDDKGQRWYVKTQQSQQHAANEIAAARLYKAAGIDAPDVHHGRGAPGLPDGPQTASRIVDGRPGTPEELRGPAREGFAVDAWLANWDVAGLTFDNMLLTPAGGVVRIDTGGSLLFRAQGGPKGNLFGDKVNEWTSLRDPDLAPQASELFSGMTPAELERALKKVQKVKPDAIRRIVADSGLPRSVADTLIARRKDLLSRLRSLQDTTKAKAKAARQAAPGMRDGVRHRTDQEGLDWAHDRFPLPALTDAEKQAIRDYTGEDFVMVGKALRSAPPEHTAGRERFERIVRDLDAAFAKAKAPEAFIAHRTTGRKYVEFLGADTQRPESMKALVGKTFSEPGYMSTSIGAKAPEDFDGAVRLMLRVPKGHGALNVMPLSEFGDSEREILLRRDSRYIVHAAYQGRDETKGQDVWFLELEIVPDDWEKPVGWAPDPYGDAADGYR